ncbi:MAG: putative baseplate assembly protein, partial [Nitrospinota bacterium]
FLYQDQGDICKTSDQFFMPFQSVSDREPALYLAFDRDISNLPGTIFFPLIAKDFNPPLEGQSQLPPVLAWEYWNGYTWSTLTVEDNTKNLTKREMVQFLSPGDLKRKACFGEDYYWIRARAEKGKYTIQPQLKGVYSNTVWAYNQLTVNDEILGSSNGQSNQVFKIAHSPVLSGATILVKESAVTEKDRETIISEEGEDAIKEVRDDAGNILETWVRWHEVRHFYFSEPYSRHFIIDRNKGMITFGDGIKGMIPQAGKDNIKCGQYRYGGGTQGNVGKRTVTKLRTSIPYIDEVTNPAAAEGGVDQESMDDVRIRGPRTIKTRNRAVTFEDFEWITQEASPKVARVKCLPATNPAKQFKPGWVTLIIVPESEDVKPLPTAELLSEIEKYLFTRTAGYLTTLVPLQQINLIPPNYIRVDVEAVVDIQSITEARIIEARILDRLQRFFHPLHGGPKGNGWDFGRNVYITEIYEVIERVEGVNYVIDAALKASEQIYKVRLDKTILSSYSFPDHSRVSFDRDKIIFSLAEKLPKDKEIDTLKVLGFMEGDRIEIRHEDEKEVIKRATFLVKSVSGNVLECESVEVDGSFPIGSIVETYLKSPDQTIKSYLISGIKANSEISQLHVAIPDAGDDFILIHRDWPSNTIHGKITDVDDTVETVYLEDNYLVYSGTHAIWNTEKGGETFMPAGAGTKGNENLISPFKGGINGGFPNKKKREEAVFQYLVNTNTGEIHNLNTIQPRCNISAIHDKNKKFITSLKEVSMEIEKGVYDYCAWCFDRKMSKR